MTKRIYCCTDDHKIYECMNDVQEEFTIQVDWDWDPILPDGCHGKDTFFQDDPEPISFRKFKDGYVGITHGMSYRVLTPENQLVVPTEMKLGIPYSPRAMAGIKLLYLEKQREGTLFSINYKENQAYADCVKDSSRRLQEHQRAVVERFVDAAIKLIPQKFASKK